MTLRDHFHKRLVSCGLWPAEADATLAAAYDGANEYMSGRWMDHIEAYPPQLISAFWLDIKNHAIQYLQATKPRHFALHILLAK